MNKMIYGIMALTLQGILPSFAQTNISIYRNDGIFNQIKLQDGIKLTHHIINNEMYLTSSDWMKGAVIIPLSAIDSCEVRHSDIPTLRLSFTDYPEVYTLWDKDLYLNANLDVEGNGFTESMEGLSLQVKGRGNSTWDIPKKPMRLKFSSKTSLCGLKKAKNFVLLNNFLDPTLMRNAIAMWLAKRLDVLYPNTIIPCHVFINDHYAGAYTLTEKIGINATSVNIEEKEGILFELGVEFKEKYQFKSKIWSLPVMIKDPDFDELCENNPDGTTTPEKLLSLWEDDFNKAEALLNAGRGAEAFDVQSAVNYILLYQITGNNEVGFPKSLYIHKKSRQNGEKYYFGPAWDFDVAYNFAQPATEGFTTVSPEKNLWMCALLSSIMETQEFKNLYAAKLKKLTEEIMPELWEYMDSYAAVIRPSAKINGMRWPENIPIYSWAYLISSFDFDAQVKQLQEWLRRRIIFLNK